MAMTVRFPNGQAVRYNELKKKLGWFSLRYRRFG